MIDRYADLSVFGGLCVYYANRPALVALVVAALGGGVMVSYARAKAESLNVRDAPGGFMRRAERAVYLGFGIFFAPAVALYSEPSRAEPTYYIVLAVCALIALLANISALQISAYVLGRFRDDNRGESRAATVPNVARLNRPHTRAAPGRRRR